MTDNEIIKALKCHKDETNNCQECTYNFGRGCSLRLAADVLDLINRQKAEIKRLPEELKEDSRVMKQALVLVDEIKKEIAVDIETAKAEAIKEFFEKLKEIASYDEIWTGEEEYVYKTIDFDEVKDLVEEMVGDTDES